jgi:hypothetical protein
VTRVNQRPGVGRAFLSGLVRCVPVIAGIFMLAANASAEVRAISIVSGTYGENCGAARGNMTRSIARQCNGRATCAYTVAGGIHKDGVPAACHSDFLAEWHCDNADFHTAALGPGARVGDTLVLSCVESRGAGK